MLKKIYCMKIKNQELYNNITKTQIKNKINNKN